MNNPVVNKYQALNLESNGNVGQDDRNVELINQLDEAEKKKKNMAILAILVVFSLLLWSGFSSDDAVVDIMGHKHHRTPPIPPQCVPGILHNITSQMPFKIWNSDKGPLPYYAYADIDKKDQREFKNVLIVAHGFGRNANEYFCSGVNALSQALEGDPSENIGDRNLDNTLIITAQFLSPGDVCWNKKGKKKWNSKILVLIDVYHNFFYIVM